MAKKETSSGGALPFFVGFILMLFVGWWVFPKVLYSEMQQPIRFSHVVHVEDGGMYCDDCHYFNDDGTYAGIPSTEDCAMCHAGAMGDTEEEAKFIEQYVDEEKEVPWLIYQYQPDNAFFTHTAHKDFECTECHPDVASMDSPPTYYRNRISGYSKQTMKMWKCERCHAEKGTSNACFVCHR